jgi:hypothetical protein
VAGAGHDTQIFRTAMLGEQIKIADRMLVILLAVDTQQRRAGLIDQALGNERQRRRDL